MKSADINATLIEGFLKLLGSLSLSNKLDLISKLTQSVKSDLSVNKKNSYEIFGMWRGDENAEDIINEIRRSRTSLIAEL